MKMKSNFGKTLIYVANRLWLIIAIYIVSVLIAAGLFAYIEEKEFQVGLWWSIVTSLTIGYGDAVPASSLGKIMAAFFGHFWVFLIIPMIVANLIMRAIENKNEFTDAEQKQVMALLVEINSKLGEKHSSKG